MGLAVTTVASGGLPVKELAGGGIAVTEVASYGIAVTKVTGTGAGMGVTFVSATGGAVTPIDPFFADTKLLMGFNGANGSTGAPGMTDESSVARGVATVNGPAQISTAQSVFGGSSLLLNGSLTYLTYLDHNDWNFSNQPFTVEFRLRPNSVAGLGFILGQWYTNPTLGWIIFINSGVLSFSVSTNGTDNIAQMTGSTLSINTWYAVALDFNGTKYRMYVNGAMVGSSTTLRTIFNSTQPLAIGASSGGGNHLNAYIDELRITKGVARYASDSGYTVATAEFPRS